ncbi:hypothetical protein QFC22_006140 [Naganishia vaughanmartiniae]|uniref:Uncharacterized protein n=1 Tax=Naganishia vaughanmartiniae TaxID=1424756 RepID=A0ACC2WPB7_9TREE|nr:hypothetical protein QFC22_006140 [Naganishia vaughanmartiniae]
MSSFHRFTYRLTFNYLDQADRRPSYRKGEIVESCSRSIYTSTQDMTEVKSSAREEVVASEHVRKTAILSAETTSLLKKLNGASQDDGDKYNTGVTENTGLNHALKETPWMLPLELLVVIAQFLAGSDQYATLASLNSTCKLVRAETLPVLYETFIMPPECAPNNEASTRLMKELLKKHGKLIKYLIKDEDFQTPSEVSNIHVEMSRGERLLRTRLSYPIYVPSVSARISNVVCATTLEHLIRLSAANTVTDEAASTPLGYPVVEECHVSGSGRILGGRHAFSVFRWSFYYEARFNFDLEDGNSKEGLQETMRYLFQAFPIANHDFEDGASPRAWISFSNVATLEAFIDSFGTLLQRGDVFPKLEFGTNEITIAEIKASMPALAATYAANWSHITPSTFLLAINLHIDDSEEYNLSNDVEDDGDSNSSRQYDDLELIFSVEDAMNLGNGQGVTFRLLDYTTSKFVLYEETYASLRMPATEE